MGKRKRLPKGIPQLQRTQSVTDPLEVESRDGAERCSYVLSRVVLGFGEEVGDLLGEVLGAGAGKADGSDDASVASPQADEPGLPGRPSSRAGGAGIDLDRDDRHGWSLSAGPGAGTADAWLLGCGQDREGPLRVEGKLL